MYISIDANIMTVVLYKRGKEFAGGTVLPDGKVKGTIHDELETWGAVELCFILSLDPIFVSI